MTRIDPCYNRRVRFCVVENTFCLVSFQFLTHTNTGTTADHLVSSILSKDNKNKQGGQPNSHLSSLRSHNQSNCTTIYVDEGRSLGTAAAMPGASRTDNPQMPHPLSNASVDRVGEQTTIQIQKMVQNLVSAMEVFPKQVHLSFVVDPAVPKEIICNDLKVFRSSIALLTSACERTKNGFVRFHIYKKVSTNPPMLVFECEDTGQDVALEQYHHLFQTPEQEQLDNETADEECITIDPATGELHRKSLCVANQTEKPPISGGFAVFPVAHYVQVCL